MTSPGGPPAYVPPTTTGEAAAPGASGMPYALPPGGYAPPPGYAVAVPRARPQSLGIAAGCTIAVGVIALLVGLAVLLVAFFLTGLFATFVPGDMTWLTGALAFFAVMPLVYGAVTLAAGAGLSAGNPSSWTTAVVVNVMSVVFALPSLFAMGMGLVHGVLSGIALWALFQPDVKAYFGR